MNFDILDLEAFLPYRFSIVEQKISRAVARHYVDAFGLMRNEWRVMATLGMFDAIPAREICRFTLLGKMQVSRAVARLSDKQFVQRAPDEKDRRSRRLSLTDKGKEIYQKIVPPARVEEKKILAILSPEEQKQLDQILIKLTSAIL